MWAGLCWRNHDDPVPPPYDRGIDAELDAIGGVAAAAILHIKTTSMILIIAEVLANRQDKTRVAAQSVCRGGCFR